MSKLVFELGVEAVPADYLPPAVEALESRAAAGLSELRLGYDSLRVLGTPFRLVLIVDGLALIQTDQTRIVQGPRADIAFADGKPTKAAEGFARKNGVAPESLKVVETDKGPLVEAEVHDVGKPAEEVIPSFLEDLIRTLAWPKTMRWESQGFLFPRPVRWVLALNGGDIVPVTIAGLPSGRLSRSHRLQGGRMFEVPHADEFETLVQSHGVVLNPGARRESIEAQLKAAAPSGGRAIADPALLGEVTFLTEHPTVYSGSFDVSFLELPKEILVTAMKSHQRYFAVEQENGQLLPGFLVVCDGTWDDPAAVLEGNERVLRARLADARFYWDVDLRRGMDELSKDLEKVVWLEPLGSMAEKGRRVSKLMTILGPLLYEEQWESLKSTAERSATIAKADLCSEMIKDGKEFTGLQGIVGARYGRAGGEPEEVCRALEEQYLPRGAKDPVPLTPVGRLLAIADRMDTIAGCWAAGFVPSGSQDPYALRRAGNGVVRILLESHASLDLGELVQNAVEGLPDAVRRPGLDAELTAFLKERVAYFLGEAGFRYDTVEAVLGGGVLDPINAAARARALEDLREGEDLEPLVVAFKRAANILKSVDWEIPAWETVDWTESVPAEAGLKSALTDAADAVAEASKHRAHKDMLAALLTLRVPIDTFFDNVMVMAESPRERDRRIALLSEVRRLFEQFCDLTKIVLEGEAQKV